MLKQTVAKVVRTIRRAVVREGEIGSDAIKPDGEEGIRVLGHREYVGGMWQVMGKHQFDFLVRHGLKPSHCLLDIACGSLRGGVRFISYLDAGNYYGIDKEAKLIELGIEKELGRGTYEQKKPQFVVSDAFEFGRFTGKKPQFALAQSLFSHLEEKDVCLCLEKLRDFVEPGHVFFATFNEGDSSWNRDTASHSQKAFRYSREQMAAFGERRGWRATYLGDWGHPNSQKMMKYEAV
jgi:ubiquinone/menaquinone biosynthesis C-methylase UbiE